ncbi:hypothetical protein [Micromonospora pallida]|uniref:hypothetical protein n=1 Tax=Micromonospora pallida TaxID=145854 RepID=UPI000B87E312|nr:hypothetical protein [Micromonospora pallida]
MTRLTLATTIVADDWVVELPRPLFLRAGEQVWIEGTAVCVRQPDGAVVRHDGDAYWLCRLR